MKSMSCVSSSRYVTYTHVFSRCLISCAKEQRQIIDDLRVNYENFKQKTNEFTAHTKDSIEAIDKKTNDTQFETKELRHIVDHFGDNLILSSTQITVESTAGFSKRPQALLDVLKTCHGNMSTAEKTLSEHGAKIAENQEAIATKADATVAFAVQSLDKDVLAIKTHLKKEEDQGISVSLSSELLLLLPCESVYACVFSKLFLRRPSGDRVTPSRCRWKGCKRD
jgi:hypothetical protein